MPFLVGSKSSATLYITNGLTGTNEKWAKIEVPFRSESINPRTSSFGSEAILGGRLTKGFVVSGRTYQGSIDMELFDYGGNHSLLAALLFALFGGYEEGSSAINKIKASDNIVKVTAEIVHGDATNAKLVFANYYVTGLSLRFPVDGVPTATLDIAGSGTGDVPSAPVSWDTLSSVGLPYVPSKLNFKIDNDSYKTQIRNLELSFSGNTAQSNTWGSFDSEVAPGLIENGTLTIEFYESQFTTSGLFYTLNSAYNGAAQSSNNLVLEITAPSDSSKVATLTMKNWIVSELSHDISGNDFIVCRATIAISGRDIELTGVSLAKFA